MSMHATPTPSDIRTYTDEQLRRHRLRRALGELFADQHYRLSVVDGRLVVGPKGIVTPEARQFIQAHRDDLVQHVAWLGEGK